MGKLDELVLAVPTAALWRERTFQGFTAEIAPWRGILFDPALSRFLPRAAAETDPSWKQIIPYVVLAHAGSVFLYRRGLKSTESRLHALHSIGLGGHIGPGDQTLFGDPWDHYQAALRRELEEEVELGAEVLQERLIGLINDDSVEVGRVHIGVVHLWELAAPAVRAREAKIAAGRFAPLTELRGPAAPELETWSRFALDGVAPWLLAKQD